MNKRINILFVCLGNSCRSPMAEGIAKKHYGRDFNVSSAGITPAGFGVHPDSVKVMSEIGIDISSHVPRALEDFDMKNIDYLVKLGDNVPLPEIKGPELIKWKIVDPYGYDIDFYRETRDKIKEHTELLIKKLKS